MLEHAAPLPHGRQRRRETPAVVAHAMPVARLVDWRHLAPAITGRMRHHRPRTGVGARVAPNRPSVDIRQAGVAAALIHEQRRHAHHARELAADQHPHDAASHSMPSTP